MSFSCLEPQVVPVTFLSSSSFLALRGTSGQDEVFVSFQFRTWNKEGLLLSSKLRQSSGGFLLYLSDGRIKINLHKTGRVLSDIAAGNGNEEKNYKTPMHKRKKIKSYLFSMCFLDLFLWLVCVQLCFTCGGFYTQLFLNAFFSHKHTYSFFPHEWAEITCSNIDWKIESLA